MILSDEADFYFNGYINKQNYHHWFATTPREKLTYSRKLSTPKSSRGIIASNFDTNQEDNNNINKFPTIYVLQ